METETLLINCYMQLIIIIIIINLLNKGLIGHLH